MSCKQTESGVAFDLLRPRAEDVHLEDIAHSLSLQCRWTGHCKSHFSVAQHSVLVAGLVPEGLVGWALMHDAAEAYIGDISTPWKRELQTLEGEPISSVESRILAAIAEALGLSPGGVPAEVKEADWRVLKAERRDLLRYWVRWELDDNADFCAVTAAPGKIVPWDMGTAEGMFLYEWQQWRVRQ